MGMKEHLEKCLFCRKGIPEHRQRMGAHFCCPDCKKFYLRERYHLANPGKQGISSSTIGAISELKVAVDLLLRGYHVFRAMSSACPCDLAILKDNRLLKIEVKTAHYTPKGTAFAPSTEGNQYDVLAVVLHDKIQYEPDLTN